MRVLVTGGTGVVGCHTVAALRSAGHDVRLMARSRDRVAPALEPVGVDPATVEVRLGALGGCDAAVRASSRSCTSRATPR